MTSDRDPQLEAMFADARQDFGDDGFTRTVISAMDRERRRALLFWSIGGLIIAVVLALLAAPVITALSLATQLLPASVVEIENNLADQLLSPINSVAAVVALAALGIRKFYNRFFG